MTFPLSIEDGEGQGGEVQNQKIKYLYVQELLKDSLAKSDQE